jgi:hypothetical protein
MSLSRIGLLPESNSSEGGEEERVLKPKTLAASMPGMKPFPCFMSSYAKGHAEEIIAFSSLAGWKLGDLSRLDGVGLGLVPESNVDKSALSQSPHAELKKTEYSKYSGPAIKLKLRY